MPTSPQRESAAAFPAARWLALAWLIVWVPSYWLTWGPANFLLLCDAAVFLTCLGFWTHHRLLLSSQAVSSIVVDAVWCLDAAWRLFSGRHLIGGTEYMWDAVYPLWVRLLSLFHAVLPIVLIWAVRRVGYDARGWRLQSILAVALLIASRFGDPSKNPNFVFRDPLLHRLLGPPVIHVAIVAAALIGIIYWPTHLVLKRWDSARASRA